MGAGKPAGIRSARKLRNTRRINRWADKKYKKMHFGNASRAHRTARPRERKKKKILFFLLFFFSLFFLCVTGAYFKSNPLQGACAAKGIVVEKMGVEVRRARSSRRERKKKPFFFR
jgi:small subunit ribosomal protein S23e